MKPVLIFYFLLLFSLANPVMGAMATSRSMPVSPSPIHAGKGSTLVQKHSFLQKMIVKKMEKKSEKLQKKGAKMEASLTLAVTLIAIGLVLAAVASFASLTGIISTILYAAAGALVLVGVIMLFIWLAR